MSIPAINLHELLKERETYPHGLISTFNFDAGFFETFVLDRLRVPRRCSHLSIFMDQGQYDELAESMLGSHGARHHLANRRYLLHPIPVNGVFHPKVLLFASDTCGLLIIGSANLTKDGLSSNAELVSVFRFRQAKDEAALPVFQQAFDFFRGLEDRWPGERVAENLDGMAEGAPWLVEPLPSPPLEPVPPVLLHNLDEPLWSQLAARLPGSVEEMWAVSRFFDESPAALDRFLAALGGPRLKVHTAPAIHNMGPSWLEHPLATQRRMEVRFCQYGSLIQPQRLHGKAYAFFGKDWGVLACGSANFSGAALLQSSRSGNVEVFLLHQCPGGGMRQAVSHLFDPDGNGRLITHASQFGPAEEADEEPVNRAKPCPVRILEAWLEDDVLRIRFAVMPPPQTRLLLSQHDHGSFHLSLPSALGDVFRIPLAADTARRLRTRSTVVRLVNGESDAVLSNPAIIAALMDEASMLETRSQRKAREAVESPARFMAILQELCAGDDERRLIDHLSRCDIAIVQHLHLVPAKKDGKGGGGKGGGDQDGYGDRAFRHFEILHDAVVDFCKRHRKRLETHVEEGTVSGVANYFHILETLLLLLYSQVERAAIGLENQKEALSYDRWKDARTNLTIYYDEMSALLKLTTNEYVRRLRQGSPDNIVRERFGKGPKEILGICSDTLKLRVRLLDLQHGELRVLRGDSNGKVAVHFMKTRISEKNWPDYVKSLQVISKELRLWMPREEGQKIG